MGQEDRQDPDADRGEEIGDEDKGSREETYDVSDDDDDDYFGELTREEVLRALHEDEDSN